MALSIIDETVKYVKNNKLKTLVLGISGGIDSALVAALASEVCNRLDNKVKLYGRILPIFSDPVEMKRAEDIAKLYCDDFKVVDLGGLYLETMDHIETPPVIKNKNLNHFYFR